MYLNCHTYFSFKYGTLSPEELIKEARRNGIRKLVLTDINNTAGYIEMLRICKQEQHSYHLEIALGIEFRRDNQMLYLGIVCNNRGFEELNRFLSHHNNEDIPLPHQAPAFDHCFMVYPWGTRSPNQLGENELVGVKIKEINKIVTSPFYSQQHRLVILHPVTLKDKVSFNIHRLLRAVDHNTLLSKLEPETQADPNEVMLPEEQLLKHYCHYPQIIANTKKLLDQCQVQFELHTDKNKATFTGSKSHDHLKLTTLAYQGFEKRYGHKANKKEAEARFCRELEVIAQKSFEAYYLITYDIVHFARNQNFGHVGRGSGANSIIAYCLELTNVDPIELDLYFERFLNPERSSPPDFDIDFSWKDRDIVTQYIFDRYGREHTALLGTHTTFKGRSILRELGKVFGLPKGEIDNLVEYPQQHRHKDHITKLIFKYAQKMLKMPSNLSIHAGGVLITEAPIYAYTATDLPPKGFPVSHFEMHNAEDMGIFKFDILSQRGLGHIKDTVLTIAKNRNIKVDADRFDEFKNDPKIKQLLRKGKTMGCFYVESPAMRMLLGKLKCEDYITLVAASSIIRPGVARSGMMREYIYRHHHPHDFEYLHPKMGELMKETYGVMVYQEDVIKVAHHFAGITLSEADILRRGMSGKFRSRKEFQRVEQRFLKSCKEKGYAPEVIDKLWFQIESFSGYSFSKGHSASYAVESYQSLYLKAHYPLEFMVGVINNFGGFYKTEFYFHEARMDGAIIEAPCVNQSDYFTNIFGKTIYIGFIHLKSLETKLGQMIPQERAANGDYLHLDDFVRRIPIGLEQLNILIRIDAFRFTGKPKLELMWQAQLYFGKSAHKVKEPLVTYGQDLFKQPIKNYQLPTLEKRPFEDVFDELELLGFSLCDPFKLLATDNRENTFSNQLIQKLNQRVEMIGYLVTTKNTATKDGKLMHFGTFYDCEGNVFDTTHFPPVARRYPFRGRGFYLLRGKVVEDFGYPIIEVDYMEKLPMVKSE